jgi:hypothetical protein
MHSGSSGFSISVYPSCLTTLLTDIRSSRMPFMVDASSSRYVPALSLPVPGTYIHTLPSVFELVLYQVLDSCAALRLYITPARGAATYCTVKEIMFALG